MKKVFISADIEGVNGIVNWKETEAGDDYQYFREEMTKEVCAACEGAKKAGYDYIFVKDAHDTARNIIPSMLPDYVILHRGWQGCPGSMMAGLDESFDACMFVGYHSPSRSSFNSLSHTMTLDIVQVKINGKIASEFTINSMCASLYNVPVAFLSGDENLCKLVKEENENIETVASKTGLYGAVCSKHPNVTYKEIEEGAYKALSKDLKNNIVNLPKSFDIEVQYKTQADAYHYSFFPGCKLIASDTISFHADNYYDALVMMKFTI